MSTWTLSDSAVCTTPNDGIVALSKSDAVPADELKRKAKALAKVGGKKPLVLSAVSGDGMTPALRALVVEIKAARAKRNAPERREAGWRP